MSLTLKQKQLLAHIWQFEQEKRIAPSLSDVKIIMGVKSFQSVIDMLNRLETAGWITKEANKARSLLLTTKAKEQLMAIGAEHMVNYKFDNTNTVDAKGSNATQSLGHNNISHSFINTSSQENNDLTLKNIALKHFDSFLNSTSTTAVVHAKSFIYDFSSGQLIPFLLFMLVTKFTSLTFEQGILVATFFTLVGKLIRGYGKEPHVTSN